MPSAEQIDLGTPYQTGDKWTADDAGLVALFGLSLFDSLRARHALADGAHKDPRIPVAAALVTCSGTTYTLRDNYRISAVTRTGVGAIKLDLSGVTLVAERWGVEVCPGPNDAEHCGVGVDPTTTTAVNVQLCTGAGAAADVSFLALVYGETA